MEKKLPQSFLDALNLVASPETPPDAKASMSSMTFEKSIDLQGKRNKNVLDLITLLISEDFREFSATLQAKVAQLLIETVQKNILMAIMDLARAAANLEKRTREKSLPFKEHICLTFAIQLLTFGDIFKLAKEVAQDIDEHQKAQRRDP